MRILLLFLLPSLTGCVTNAFYAKHSNHDYKLEDFNGVYVPHRPLTKEQEQVFGSKITITNFIPNGVAESLKASYQKAERTNPGLTVEITRETEEPTLAASTSRLYYMGVNQGQVDLVHYDFDGKHNAFERTDTTLKKNTISHKKSVLIYKKKDKAKQTAEAGLNVQHDMKLFGRLILISHQITKLSDPWLSVFPPGDLQKTGQIKAAFIRVEQPRYDARYRLYRETDHRR